MDVGLQVLDSALLVSRTFIPDLIVSYKIPESGFPYIGRNERVISDGEDIIY